MRDLVGAETVNGRAFEDDFAFIWFSEAGNAVEESRFAGAVRSDDGNDGLIGDLEVNRIDGDKPSESFRDVFGGENSCHGEPL